jgi:hypothetical protein
VWAIFEKTAKKIKIKIEAKAMKTEREFESNPCGAKGKGIQYPVSSPLFS